MADAFSHERQVRTELLDKKHVWIGTLTAKLGIKDKLLYQSES